MTTPSRIAASVSRNPCAPAAASPDAARVAALTRPPVQIGWLERLFVNYDGARIVHFGCMLALGSFIVPHVALAIADGWGTVRSMVVGWSPWREEKRHD